MKKQYTKPCAELINFEVKTSIMDNNPSIDEIPDVSMGVDDW